METKHTPGPWGIVQDHPDAGTRKSLADIRPLGGKGYEPWYSCPVASLYLMDDPRQQANALLIAAAPDLLEVLKNLVACVDLNGDVPSWTGQWNAARAAIRKATHQD